MEGDEPKHTPSPWKVGEPGGPAGPFYGIVNSEGRVIAMQVLNEADARRIVTCVNSHDDLLEACKEICKFIDPHSYPDGLPSEFFEDFEVAVDRIEKAIAKAEGKQP